jgi:hypothetical protein
MSSHCRKVVGCDSWYQSSQGIGSLVNLQEEDVELLFQVAVGSGKRWSNVPPHL